MDPRVKPEDDKLRVSRIANIMLDSPRFEVMPHSMSASTALKPDHNSVPNFTFEEHWLAKGKSIIAGIDEAGRGPLAGPVVAAAVVLDGTNIPNGLDDSKRLSEPRREVLLHEILARAQVGWASVPAFEIDRLNIRQATLKAMRLAISRLPNPADVALIDGRDIPAGLPCDCEAIIGGDGRSLSIAAASIVAKVWRDRHMVDLAQQYPGYGWEKNAGYPTAVHKSGLENLGVTPHHRRSFKPVHNILYQE